MTFILDALRDKPQGLFQMNGSTLLQDYSGYSATAQIVGPPPTRHPSLVRGAPWSPVLTNTTQAEFLASVFKKDSEDKQFTLSAWVRVVSGSSEQQILGNPGQLDGITINGTIVSFVIKYTTASEARCTFDLQTTRAAAVWAVYTSSKISLYIDGQLVDEYSLSESQQADTFAGSAANLSSGATAGAQAIAVNAVAYYPFAMSGLTVTRQFRSGRALPSYEQVVSANAGAVIPVTLRNVSLFLNQTWASNEDWTFGNFSNTALVNHTLVPQFSGDTSVPGVWYDSVAIGSANSVAIYGVYFDWDGEGATVDVSLDGVTWTTASKSQNVSIVPAGFDPTGKVLLVRVSFPGGILNDTSHVNSLNAIGILSSTSLPDAGRTVAYTNATPNHDFPAIEMNEHWGAKIGASGSVTLSADTMSSRPIRTIEMWVRPNAAFAPAFGTASETYQNGLTSAANLKAGQWVVYHRVLSADLFGSIVINIPGQLGYLAVYDRPLTAQEVAGIYASQVGTNTSRVTDSSVIGVTESATAADIYAYDWSIIGSG